MDIVSILYWDIVFVNEIEAHKAAEFLIEEVNARLTRRFGAAKQRKIGRRAADC